MRIWLVLVIHIIPIPIPFHFSLNFLPFKFILDNIAAQFQVIKWPLQASLTHHEFTL